MEPVAQPEERPAFPQSASMSTHLSSGGTLKAAPPAPLNLDVEHDAHPLSSLETSPVSTRPSLVTSPSMRGGFSLPPSAGPSMARHSSNSSSVASLPVPSPKPVERKAPLFPDRPEPLVHEEDVTAAEDWVPRKGGIGLKREDTLKASTRLRGKSTSVQSKGKGKVKDEEERLDRTISFRRLGQSGDDETLTLSLSSPPHRLDTKTLASELAGALSLDQTSRLAQVDLTRLALLLIQQLSSETASTARQLATKDAEVAALVELLTKNHGVGEGEVERCRVRARAEATASAEGEGSTTWSTSIPVLGGDGHIPEEPEPASRGRPLGSRGHAPSVSATSIDLEIQEAMSDAGFDARSLHSADGPTHQSLDAVASSAPDLPSTSSSSHLAATAIPVLPQATPTSSSKVPGSLSALRLWGGTSSPNRSKLDATPSPNPRDPSPVPSDSTSLASAPTAATKLLSDEALNPLRHSRTSSVSSASSLTSQGAGGAGATGAISWLGWKWNARASSGGVDVHGTPRPDVDTTGTIREPNPVHRAEKKTSAEATSIPTATGSSAYESSLRTSMTSSSSPEHMGSSISTSVESTSPTNATSEAPLRPLKEDEAGEGAATEHPKRPTQCSPMTALISKWAPESSPAITTPALVQTSFSNPSTSPMPPEAEFGVAEEAPRPPHFTAVAQSASQWVSASGAMDGLLHEAAVSPKIEETAQALLTSVAATADKALGMAVDQAEVGDGIESPPGSRIAITAQGLSPTTEKFPNIVRRVSANAVPPSLSVSTSAGKAKPKGYLASAKGTLGRALGLGHASTGKRPGKALQPNVTVPTVAFRRLAPATAPSMTLSTSQTSLAAVGGTRSSGKSAPQPTMELDTIIAGDARPPTLADTQQLARTPSAQEPITDRYGFIVDLKSGIKLLRESRKRKDETESITEDLEDSDVLTPALPVKSQVDVEAELDSLREALGLPLLSPPTGTASADAKPGPAPEPTNQSIRRLLGQLNDMHQTLERSQTEAWDVYIRKRQAKLSRLDGGTDMALSGRNGGSAASMLGTAPTNRDSICYDENLIGVASMGAAGRGGREDWKEFKDLVRKGIPISLRPRIWAECSGATERREPGYFADLLSAHDGEEGLALTQIECDVTRTLPTNVYFGGDGPGVDKLRRVLAAMSWHNPVVGYCQGMNMVAGTLLLTLPTDEDAFWVLTCIIERILPSDYYTSHLLVSQADQRVLRDLVTEFIPVVSNHLQDLEMELPAITFGWFLSLFADALPMQTLLRVFDLFLIEGSILLFRVALALLKINAADICSHDSPATLYAFMRGPMTLSSHHADRLVQVACDDFRDVKNKHVAALRLKHVDQLREEMGLVSPPS